MTITRYDVLGRVYFIGITKDGTKFLGNSIAHVITQALQAKK